jgi:hypothetical protein
MAEHIKVFILETCEHIREDIRESDNYNIDIIRSCLEELELYEESAEVYAYLLKHEYIEENIDESDYTHLELGLAGLLFKQGFEINLDDTRDFDPNFCWKTELRQLSNTRKVQ